MINAIATNAITAATTLMAILEPVDRPFEGLLDFGVVVGVGERALETLDVVDEAVEDGAAEEVES